MRVLSRMRGRRFSARCLFGGAAVAAAALSAQTAVAQATAPDPPRERLLLGGIAGGFAQGPASLYDARTIGYNLQASLALRTPVRLLRVRTDAGFMNWGANRLTAVTINALLTPSLRSGVRPYALVGGGAYSELGSGTAGGWSVGAGLRVPMHRSALLLESRVHHFRDTRFGEVRPYPLSLEERGRGRVIWTPVTFGVEF